MEQLARHAMIYWAIIKIIVLAIIMALVGTVVVVVINRVCVVWHVDDISGQ